MHNATFHSLGCTFLQIGHILVKANLHVIPKACLPTTMIMPIRPMFTARLNGIAHFIIASVATILWTNGSLTTISILSVLGCFRTLAEMVAPPWSSLDFSSCETAALTVSSVRIKQSAMLDCVSKLLFSGSVVLQPVIN